MGLAWRIRESLNKHPCWLQQRERNEPDNRGDTDHQRIADLEAEQHGQADDGDQRGQPVAAC